MNTRFRRFANPQKWASGLFWSWNLIFLAFMFLGFAPTVLPEMMNAVRSGDFPATFVVYAIILTLIPAVAVLLGFTLLRRQPERLFALGYGVEGPLMLIVALRFFVVRQVTAAVALLLLVAGLGILTYLWQLLDRRINERGPWLAHVRLIGLTLLLLAGLYASLWIAFYALPLGVQGVKSLGEFLRQIWHQLVTLDWRSLQWRPVPFSVLGVILLLFSATLFVLMPVAVSILYVRAWWQGVRALATAYSRPRAIALSTVVLALLLILIIQAGRQPQHRAFALLETTPTSIDEAQALLAQEASIRRGLLNAYLAPQRYVSAVGEVQHVSDMYRWGLGLSAKEAGSVQRFYETVARPVLYEPVEPAAAATLRFDSSALRQEPARAAELYQQFFDQPINKGERDAVIRAARSTWSIDQARAAWQAVDDREIRLTRQEVTITEQGDWAEVELHEVYQNQTRQRQEVVYYFSLPESAVITGVWLGNSDNRDSRFVFHVAPRGAAQATYRNEVRRNIDPALVEQIGPSQYRLRVFPIEPQRWSWSNDGRHSTLNEGPPLHLWLTWRTLAVNDGWPMPYLAEKRNVYWDSQTVRLINGAPMEADNETWLPAAVPATAPITAVAHRVDFPDGTSVLAQPVETAELSTPTGDLRLAVVVDRSRSMAPLAGEVEAALAELGQWGSVVDVYLTASPYRGEEVSRLPLADLDPAAIVYYGGQNAAELLAQFAALQNGTAYDAIFVLTDGTGYELGDPQLDVPVPAAPVWMVHLGGNLPIGYDDATLAAIQASGGGTVGRLADGLTRLLTTQAGEPADLVDGYLWTVLPTTSANALNNAAVGEGPVHAPSDDFAALAARRLILAEMRAQRENLAELTTLDYLHALAIEHSIVTPYSSMIVLVTRQQEQLLRQLSEQDDRFEREFEDIGETTPENPFTVTGVPEPEEWLLLGLAVGMLAWYVVQSRRPVRHQPAS